MGRLCYWCAQAARVAGQWRHDAHAQGARSFQCLGLPPKAGFLRAAHKAKHPAHKMLGAGCDDGLY